MIPRFPDFYAAGCLAGCVVPLQNALGGEARVRRGQGRRERRVRQATSRYQGRRRTRDQPRVRAQTEGDRSRGSRAAHAQGTGAPDVRGRDPEAVARGSRVAADGATRRTLRAPPWRGDAGQARATRTPPPQGAWLSLSVLKSGVYG